MALSPKQVAAIAESKAGKSSASPFAKKAFKETTEGIKAPQGKVTAGLKAPPKIEKEKDIKVPASKTPAAPKFQIKSIDDIRKARQKLQGDN